MNRIDEITIVTGEAPNFRPLEARYVDDECIHWMWVYGYLDRAGKRWDAYKHVDTREYLYLDANGDQPAGARGRI